MTVAMLHVDRARSRLPLVCTAISLMGVAVVGALVLISWLLDPSQGSLNVQNAAAAHSLSTFESNQPVADAPDAEASNSDDVEPWVRSGREF